MVRLDRIKWTLAAGIPMILLAACDNPPYCSEPCHNPRHARDPFCDCYDPNARPTGSGSSGNQDSSRTPVATLEAQCICPYSNGLVGAYFNYQPSEYNSFRKVKVTATGCIDLTRCEIIDAGDGAYTQPFQTGTVELVPQTWNRSPTNIYTLLGYPVNQTARHEEPSGIMKASLSFGAGTYLRLNRLLHKAQFSNDPASCTKACTEGSPYCMSDDLPTATANSIAALYDRLTVTVDGTIEESFLKDLFDVQGDPCGRGDTKIGTDIFENEGDLCFITSNIPQVDVGLEVSVPPRLSGSIERSTDLLIFRFPDVENAPYLKIEDELLHSDWGGTIKSVTASSQNVTFAVGAKSCIQVALPAN